MSRLRSACAGKPVVLGLLLMALTLGAEREVRAEPTAEADAERLFREGQKLLERRRFGEACPKFEAAYAKDGQLGTLLNLAFCHAQQGATWTAWVEFREAEAEAKKLGRSDNEAFAHEQRAALEKRLPRLVVDNPRGMPLTDVLVEDRRIPGAEAGEVFAAEPGDRKVTFVATGKKAATVLVEVARAREPVPVRVPPLENADPAPPPRSSVTQESPSEPSPAPPEAANPEPAPVAEDDAARPTGTLQRTLGYAALGLAGVAVAAGATTGVLTLQSPCAGRGTGCTYEDRDDAATTARLSNVSFAVAGAALVGGVVLLLTAPDGSARASTRPVSPLVGAGWAGVRGRF